MPVIRKFDFDVSFDRRAAPVEPESFEPEPEIEIPPPPPIFTLGEVEAARRQARADGHLDGEKEAHAGIERRLADAVTQLEVAFRGFADQQVQAVDQVERQAAEITLILIRKLFPALAERSGTAEIEALLAEAFRHAIDEPRIVVRCAPSMKEALEPIVRDAARLAGFDGKYSVSVDHDLMEVDCRVEWAEGGIERTPRQMIDAIETAVLNGLAEFDHRHAEADPGAAPTVDPLEETAA